MPNAYEKANLFPSVLVPKNLVLKRNTAFDVGSTDRISIYGTEHFKESLWSLAFDLSMTFGCERFIRWYYICWTNDCIQDRRKTPNGTNLLGPYARKKDAAFHYWVKWIKKYWKSEIVSFVDRDLRHEYRWSRDSFFRESKTKSFLTTQGKTFEKILCSSLLHSKFSSMRNLRNRHHKKPSKRNSRSQRVSI